jgi:hypothetical protein
MPGTHDSSVRSYRYYVRNTGSAGSGPTLTTSFQNCQLIFIDREDGKTNFTSQGVIISNDSSSDEISYSFDGITVDGDLLPNESINFFSMRHKVVYLLGASGGEPYRVIAW